MLGSREMREIQITHTHTHVCTHTGFFEADKANSAFPNLLTEIKGQRACKVHGAVGRVDRARAKTSGPNSQFIFT